MKTRPCACRLSLAALMAAVCPLGAEMTPAQTISFFSGSDGTFTDFLNGDFTILADSPLDGFTKFDPALGTLTEILFTIEVAGSYEIALSASEGDLDDPFSPFTLFYDAQFGVSLQADIVYTPTGGAFGSSVASEGYQVFDQLGGFDLNPDDYGAEEGAFEFYECAMGDFGGFANGGTTLTTGSVLASEVNLSDFVGTDGTPVAGLEFFTFADVENSGASGVFSNLSFASIEFSLNHEGRSATIQYVYTPAVTSDPPVITGYQKSGITHTILFTGEPSKTDWQVHGGTSPENLSVDHTASAAITEPGAGQYQAIVTLPALTEPTYFFGLE